jgi:hypothetical protein
MGIRDRIAVISLVVLSAATASFGANYIREDAIVPQDGRGARSGSDTKAPLDTSRRPPVREVGEVEQRERLRIALRPHGPPVRNSRPGADDSGTAREKTLAALLLMLRDGRGAR